MKKSSTTISQMFKNMVAGFQSAILDFDAP